MKYIKIFYQHYEMCRVTNSNFLIWLISRIYYSFIYKIQINKHHKACIKGIRNLSINKSLRVGMNAEGFVPRGVKTYLNIQGKVKIKKSWIIGRGCSIYVAPGGYMEVGDGGYVNSYTKFIIGDRLIIGDNCIISWNCQFLNEGSHEIEYEGRKPKSKEIRIGNNVWIGNNVKVYEGTIIPDNSVIASYSVVKSAFYGSNLLIGGSPSRILKENITWKL